MPDPDAARRFFDAIAARYDRDFARSSRDIERRLLRALGGLRTPRVLDLGIGTGRELVALSAMHAAVTGIDASEAMLAEARGRGRGATLVHGDFYGGLPFAEASFDAVLALHGTLAHPPTEAALVTLVRGVARVLVAGGLFYVELPTEAWTREHGGAFVDPKSGARLDACVFSETAWRTWLTAEGFSEVEAWAGEGEIAYRAVVSSPQTTPISEAS